MKKTFDPINAIRLIAVLMVFLLHSLLLNGKNFPMNQVLEQNQLTFVLFTPAWAGCWIFFLVSGYLAGKNFVAGKYELNKSGVFKYYKRKVSKVYLPTMLFIGFCVVMVEPSFFSHDKVWLKMITCTYYGDPGFNGVRATWFVFTLMWLYLLAPVGAYIFKKVASNRLMYIWGGLLLVGIATRIYAYNCHLDWVVYTYTAPFANIDLFFSGMLLSYFEKNRSVANDSRNAFYIKVTVLLFLTLLVINSYMIAYNKYIEIYQYIFPTVYIIFSMAYLWFVSNIKFDRESMAFGIINWLSGISFEFYLFHSLIMGRVSTHIGGHTPIEQYFKYMLVVIPVTIVFSMGYHRILYRR